MRPACFCAAAWLLLLALTAPQHAAGSCATSMFSPCVSGSWSYAITGDTNTKTEIDYDGSPTACDALGPGCSMPAVAIQPDETNYNVTVNLVDASTLAQLVGKLPDGAQIVNAYGAVSVLSTVTVVLFSASMPTDNEDSSTCVLVGSCVSCSASTVKFEVFPSSSFGYPSYLFDEDSGTTLFVAIRPNYTTRQLSVSTTQQLLVPKMFKSACVAPLVFTDASGVLLLAISNVAAPAQTSLNVTSVATNTVAAIQPAAVFVVRLAAGSELSSATLTLQTLAASTNALVWQKSSDGRVWSSMSSTQTNATLTADIPSANMQYAAVFRCSGNDVFTPSTSMCVCKPGWVGPTCQFACAGLVPSSGGLVCGGPANGVCVANLDNTAAICACTEHSTGTMCENSYYMHNYGLGAGGLVRFAGDVCAASGTCAQPAAVLSVTNTSTVSVNSLDRSTAAEDYLVLPFGTQTAHDGLGFVAFQVATSTSAKMLLTSSAFALDAATNTAVCVLFAQPSIDSSTIVASHASAVDVSAPGFYLTIRALASPFMPPSDGSARSLVLPAMAGQACVAPITLLGAGGQVEMWIYNISTRQVTTLAVAFGTAASPNGTQFASDVLQLTAAPDIAGAVLTFNSSGLQSGFLTWAVQPFGQTAWSLLATAVAPDGSSASCRISGATGSYAVLLVCSGNGALSNLGACVCAGSWSGDACDVAPQPVSSSSTSMLMQLASSSSTSLPTLLQLSSSSTGAIYGQIGSTSAPSVLSLLAVSSSTATPSSSASLVASSTAALPPAATSPIASSTAAPSPAASSIASSTGGSSSAPLCTAPYVLDAAQQLCVMDASATLRQVMATDSVEFVIFISLMFRLALIISYMLLANAFTKRSVSYGLVQSVNDAAAFGYTPAYDASTWSSHSRLNAYAV